MLTLLTLLMPGRENQREVQKQHCPVGVGVDYLLAARKRPAGNIMMIRMIMEEEIYRLVVQDMANLMIIWVDGFHFDHFDNILGPMPPSRRRT